MSSLSIKSCTHQSCPISSLKALRNGFYYGGRVRFMHSLVMTILFKKGTMREKIANILELTFEHGKSLGFFAFCFKSFLCLLRKFKKIPDSLCIMLSGGTFGFFVFGNKTSVNYQIILYVFSRVIVGSAEIFANKGILPNINAYPLLSAIAWSLVMFLFEDDPSILQNSLASSMQFLYKESDKDLEKWTDLIPFEVPDIINRMLY